MPAKVKPKIRIKIPTKEEIEQQKKELLKYQKELREKRTPKYFRKRKSYKAVKEAILRINNIKHQAFVALVYATMGRIGEVVRHSKDKPKQEKNWINPPISKEDIIKKKTKKGKRLIVISLFTEKVRKPRVVVIPYEKEKWLGNIILRYTKLSEEYYLFNKSVRWGQLVFKKYFGTQNIHVLRHYRITHWLSGEVTGKPVRERIVARMAGHTSISTQAHHYDHTIFEDYEDEIY
ncbi:MAG: hypothetical protein ACOC2M_00565 [bacterium]